MPGEISIVHCEGSSPALFRVAGTPEHPPSPVPVPSPYEFPVEGQPHSHLMRELRWYLEHFLDYPFDPETTHAERVLAALKAWGMEAFTALFACSEYRNPLFGAETVRISSDAPAVLSWPWEALCSPETGYLARRHAFERHMNRHRDARDFPDFPRDRVNILLVVARPFESDVRFRSIARPLVDLIEREGLPARVDVLRPPTFEQLRKHLDRRPHYYHVIHFDCHGIYGAAEPASERAPGHPEGHLVLERADGGPDRKSARDLSILLQEYAVPAVVLNACQSAQITPDAGDVFAAIATALLASGVPSVVAMAYSLYVSGAEIFLPAFYRRLFENGRVAEAVRAGRLELLAHPERAYGRIEDWLVPVLYQQDPIDFDFAARQGTSSAESRLPAELRESTGSRPLIGRDRFFLDMERAVRGKAPAILLRGLAGIGKTSLAQAFLRWLDDTGGLDGAQWFDFREIRTAEAVINAVGEVFGAADFRVARNKPELLQRALRDQRVLIVWDNFECAADQLAEKDREELLAFLDTIRETATKVIVTSRVRENWLGKRCFDLGLRGLDGEERWTYSAMVLSGAGLKADLGDSDLGALMEQLAGHPLAMQAVLPKLAHLPAKRIVEALRTNALELGLGSGKEEEQPFAALRFVDRGLAEDLRPLLALVGLHDGYLEADLLETMARQVDCEWTRPRIERLTGELNRAGLIQSRGKTASEIHPLLSSYLRNNPNNVSAQCQHAFADEMAKLASGLAPQHAHQQRVPFRLHRANFYAALELSKRLSLSWDYAALAQALGAYAQDSRNFREAARLFQLLAQHWTIEGDRVAEASAYHQIAMIAQAEGDSVAARKSYLKSLAIEEELGNEIGAALTCHQLGRIAEDENALAQARDWYLKALLIFEQHDKIPEIASTYHQLGSVAEAERELGNARVWYQKSVALKETHGDLSGAATTYQQLGSIAQEERDFRTARDWYRKALAILEPQGNLDAVAIAYHQLGLVAQQERDFVAARDWYLKSIAIKEKQGNLRGAASTYHGMGRIAEEQGGLEIARDWYRKSLAISIDEDDRDAIARAYHQLGSIAEEQRHFSEAIDWYRKSLDLEEQQGNLSGIAISCHQLGSVARQQRDFGAALEWLHKSLAVSEQQKNVHAIAMTSGEIGIVAGLRGDIEGAGRWLVRSVAGLLKTNDDSSAESNTQNLMLFYDRASAEQKRQFESIWQENDLGPFPKSIQ
jgi:tetratricopeptide (TPR) repeat protein